MHKRRLCTQLCPFVRHTWSGIIVLTLGSQSLQRVVSATSTFFPSYTDFGAAPRAQAARGYRRCHIEHLLFACQCIPGLDSSVALDLLRHDLIRVCSRSDHAEAVLLAAFPTTRIPIVTATAYNVPFLLHPAVALDCMSPWHMKLPCLDIIATFLLGVLSGVCTHPPPSAYMFEIFA